MAEFFIRHDFAAQPTNNNINTTKIIIRSCWDNCFTQQTKTKPIGAQPS